MSDISSKEKRELAKQRREAAKQAQKYHKEQKKRAKKSSDATQHVKLPKRKKDFEDGYYIDEYSEKKRSERRAKVIRKQEQEVIRRNKKPITQKQARNRRIIIATAILLTVLVVGAVLSLTVLFKTEKIDIEGDEYYYEDQIIAFSNVSLQQNIFLAAIGGTPQEIVKNLPYVEDAKIGFAVPDTVTITITNALPSYYVKDGDKYLIISSKGRVLDTETEEPENAAELICNDYKNKEIGSYIEFEDKSVPDILESVANSLKANGLDNIKAFDVTDTSAITIDYAGKIKINIGVAEDIDYKIKTAAAIITQKLDPNNTGQVYGTLDVSTSSKNKMSHFKPAETTPATEPSTTAPAQDTNGGTTDWNANANNNNNYDANAAANNTYDGGAGANNYDANTYDNGAVYDNGASYNNNAGGVYDNGYGNNTAGNGNYYAGDLGGGGADGAAPY